MAKNITILEGRETRTFGGVEKLQTNLAGGGTQNWIPEDEAADYVDAEDLEVDENGYYAPEPGSFFSSVDVNVEVEPDLEEITITENGTYTPQGDGFSSVSVEVDTSGGGGDPEVHGQEVTAIATVDITAGDTVAVQNESPEPVSVSCPMPERLFDQYGTASPIKFDGKNIYWIKYIDPWTREVRKKPIANIGSEQYTVVATIGTGWGGVEPWYVKGQGEDEQGAYQTAASVFTKKELKLYIQGSQGIQFMSMGKYTGEVLSNATYDKALKKVNEGYISNRYYSCRQISGARGILAGTSDGFAIALNGGITTYYNAIKPSGIDTLAAWGFAMVAGNNALCIGYDSNSPTHKTILAYPFDESEYDQPRETEATSVCSLDFTSYTIGSDTTFDRWAIATDNGLIVIRSDLSYDIFPTITATTTPYLVGDYVFIGASCYKLTDDGAKMVPTSSKGTEGRLGVAKHNVQAGEEGTAVILFS